MNNPKQYKVTFGRTAGTLVYEDQEGTLHFGFDISPAKEPEKGEWMIDLGSTPRTAQGKLIQVPDFKRERLSFAIEKTKEYLLSRGYQVRL